ncbi:hypothetical protein AA313_de0205027 [Arthrobotrys entomopaga]|nr:hypothetical protein AA313_de0205027 [Arthrobotrys entomopaga]
MTRDKRQETREEQQASSSSRKHTHTHTHTRCERRGEERRGEERRGEVPTLSCDMRHHWVMLFFAFSPSQTERGHHQPSMLLVGLKVRRRPFLSFLSFFFGVCVRPSVPLLCRFLGSVLSLFFYISKGNIIMCRPRPGTTF